MNEREFTDYYYRLHDIPGPAVFLPLNAYNRYMRSWEKDRMSNRNAKQ